MILNQQTHSPSPNAPSQGQEGSGRYLCLSIDEKDSSKVPLFSVGTGEYRKTVHGVCGIRRMKFWKTDKRGGSAELAGKAEWPFPSSEKHDVVIGCNVQGTACRVTIADRPDVHWDIAMT